MFPASAVGNGVSAGREGRSGWDLTKIATVSSPSWRAERTVHGSALLYAVGRQANSDQLNMEAIGLVA